jgi:hypothetical protein
MRTVYDPVANQTTSFLRYEKWRDGGLIATELQRFRLQYWSLTEFERLLADAGFTDINVTADTEMIIGRGRTAESGPSTPSGRGKGGRPGVLAAFRPLLPALC